MRKGHICLALVILLILSLVSCGYRCDNCQDDGVVACATCNGEGEYTCPFCQGSATEQNTDGASQKCHYCRGGRIDCPLCNEGKMDCTDCDQ